MLVVLIHTKPFQAILPNLMAAKISRYTVHTSGDVTRVRVHVVLVCKQEKVAENLQHM